MIDEEDRGRKLAFAVAERVAANYPATSVDICDGGRYHGTIATFTPRNHDGAQLTLFATFDWSFDIHVGRFILFEDEPMMGSEAERIDLVVTEILEVAREGISPGFLDRFISTGGDRLGPWEQ